MTSKALKCEKSSFVSPRAQLFACEFPVGLQCACDAMYDRARPLDKRNCAISTSSRRHQNCCKASASRRSTMMARTAKVRGVRGSLERMRQCTQVPHHHPSAWNTAVARLTSINPCNPQPLAWWFDVNMAAPQYSCFVLIVFDPVSCLTDVVLQVR